jgi:hypothetical protein
VPQKATLLLEALTEMKDIELRCLMVGVVGWRGLSRPAQQAGHDDGAG